MRLEPMLSAVGFWSATVLPVCYLPLFATGIDSRVGALSFLGLLVVNVLALVVGHDYRRG